MSGPLGHLYASAKWRRIRRIQLLAEPLCRLCAQRGIVTPADVVDHVIPHGGNVNNFWLNPLPSPIGSFRPNAFGLYDMAGNVWQWVQVVIMRTTTERPPMARSGQQAIVVVVSSAAVPGATFPWPTIGLSLRGPRRRPELQYRLPCRENAFAVNIGDHLPRAFGSADRHDIEVGFSLCSGQGSSPSSTVILFEGG
jgi:hypothetical protein